MAISALGCRQDACAPGIVCASLVCGGIWFQSFSTNTPQTFFDVAGDVVIDNPNFVWDSTAIANTFLGTSAQDFSMSAGAVASTNWSVNRIGETAGTALRFTTDFNQPVNFQINNGTVDISSNDFQVSSIAVNSGGTLRLEGHQTFPAPSVACGSTVYFEPTSDLTLPRPIGITYSNLTVAPTTPLNTTVTLPADGVWVANNFTIGNGINEVTVEFSPDGFLAVGNPIVCGNGTILTVNENATFSNTGTGDFYLLGSVENEGVIYFNSSDDYGNGITIHYPTILLGQSNWSGSGTFHMEDIVVDYQTAISPVPVPGPEYIYVISGVCGPNVIDWICDTHITDVSATTANGTYGIGDTITITVTFSGAVDVSGAPQLQLDSGGSAIATYLSGTGSNTLVFEYTVQEGDVSADLDYDTTTSLELNGGTITAAGGVNANITLAQPNDPGSLGYNKNLVIDGIRPVVTVASLTTLDNTPALSGTVDDPTASVVITVNGSSYNATNNGDGTWTLADNTLAALANGTYDVIATATDPAGNSGVDATTNELTIYGFVFSGRAHLVGGEGVPGVSIVLSGAAPQCSGSTTTAIDGSYTIGRVPDGTSCTITPSLDDNLISPSSIAASVGGADSTGNDFLVTYSGTPTFASCFRGDGCLAQLGFPGVNQMPEGSTDPNWEPENGTEFPARSALQNPNLLDPEGEYFVASLEVFPQDRATQPDPVGNPQSAAYLWTDSGLNVRNNGKRVVATASLTITFTVDRPLNDFCYVWGAYGSERDRIEVLHENGETVAPVTIDGTNERVAKEFVRRFDTLAAGTHSFTITYIPGHRSNNGHYFDYWRAQANCSTHPSVPLGANAPDASLGMIGYPLWQLGVIDSSSGDEKVYSDEFQQFAARSEVFSYDVESNSDVETVQPELPAYISPSPVEGANSTKELQISFTLDKSYPNKALSAYFGYYGLGDVYINVDGRDVAKSAADPWPSLHAVSQMLPALSAGRHTLRLRADNPAALDYIVLLDTTRRDLDRDGLSNGEEFELGTDPSASDTDNDGRQDPDELSDGSNPRDSGSVLDRLQTRVCSDYNRFLEMLNIKETINLPRTPRLLREKVYTSAGAPLSSLSYSIPGSGQFDLLVHDVVGVQPNTYGNICFTHDGAEGDVAGQMVMYKLNAGDATYGNFDFVYGIPFSNGIRVEQAVPYNTFHPSLTPAGALNLAANWIQVSHVAESEEDVETVSGVLTFYDASGQVAKELALDLRAGQRQDISAHDLGKNRVGLAVWRPLSKYSERRVKLSNTRYYYDNPGTGNSFDSVFHLPAVVGSGERLVAPLDLRSQTAVVELLNLSAQENAITVVFYNSAGVVILQREYRLAGYTSLHLIANDLLPSLANSAGSVAVQGLSLGSAGAVVMQYGRNSDASLSFAYGVAAKEALGATFTGSYNTFLQQSCTLTVVNSSSEAATAKLSIYRSDGRAIKSNQPLSLAPHGQTSLDVCLDAANNYGSVVLTAAKKNTLAPFLVRYGRNNAYRFPTPLR